MLTRRQFHARLIASFAAAAAPFQLRATVASASDLWLNRLFGLKGAVGPPPVGLNPYITVNRKLSLPAQDARQ